MSPISIVILAFSMSADACAAAIARGAATRPTLMSALKGGAVFGAIEALTPIIGWAAGIAASGYIAAIDHWVAFILLAAVGGKMLVESARRLSTGDEEPPSLRGGPVGLVLTALATSIDAAAVGVTLALVDANILVVAAAIGATTFTLATGGMLIGRAAGARFGPVIEMIGGVGLIAIGLGILLEHTGIFV